MTSVNELNAYNRGKREGYDIGYNSAMEYARREGTALRWWKLIIAGLIGFMLGAGATANAQTATTTLEVVIPVQITAEVPCNPVNCPEIPQEEPAQVENITQEETVLERLWSAILRVIAI